MKKRGRISRRQALRISLGAMAVAAGMPGGLRGSFAGSAPSSPVAIGKCDSYGDTVLETLADLFDKIGGMGNLVKGKSVCIKVNLTGDPRRMVAGLPANRTYHTHPAVLHAACILLGKAGARQITIAESLLFNRPKEEVFEWAGWDLGVLRNSANDVRFEDTRNKGSGKDYIRVKVPWGGYTYPAYELNEAYVKTDVYVSIAKLKEHVTAGVTLAMKNMFGVAPNAIYGDDAGSEDAHAPRGAILHRGVRQPPIDVEEINPGSPREGGYRVPRVTVDLVGARPINLAIIDGIESMQGGEGPWCRNVKPIKPGVLIVGRNPVCVDAVGMTIMGFDPEADRGAVPFIGCDNHLKLAAAVGIGTNRVPEIELRGLPIDQAIHPYDASLRTPYSENLQREFIR